MPCLGQMNQLESLTPTQLKKFGSHAQKVGDLHTAIFFYEAYQKYKPGDIGLTYDLANLHREVRNYEKAMVLYEKVIDKSIDKYPLAEYYYAQMLKSVGRYDDAIENFTSFRKNYRGKRDYSDYSRLARNAINGCDTAKLLIASPLNITIGNLNNTVNSPHIELSPVPVNDSMFIYASLRVDSLVYFTNENVDASMPVRQFYVAQKEGYDWVGGQPLSGDINIPGVETGNGVLSRDGTKFYFTRCADNWQGKTICAIYVTHRNGTHWTTPEKLPPVINDPNFTTTQPAIGRTAKTNSEVLYFVSDRPDGRGGLDIWYTMWSERKQLWSKPGNLGSRINTNGDEMTPFYDLGTRTLFYSSDGKPGMGGLDVLKAFGERRSWTKPVNVGFPVNSSYDDLYYTVSRTGEDGFFVSNRPGIDSLSKQTCCDDIFYYKWNDFVRIWVTGQIYPFEKDKYGRKRDLTNFDFFNPPDSILPLNKAVIALYLKEKESGEYIFMERDTTGLDGRFYFTLLPDQEYEFKMEGFQYFDSKNYLSTEFMTFSDTLEMPPIWVNVLTDKPVELKDVLYEFNSAELTPKAKNVLDTTLLVLMREAPEFIIELSSHTDSIGSFEYNMELSQARAQGVVDYLISKGISADRLVAKGYGASMPVAPNYLPDGSDNPIGREQNRRTEFKIIGSTNALEEDEVFEDE